MDYTVAGQAGAPFCTPHLWWLQRGENTRLEDEILNRSVVAVLESPIVTSLINTPLFRRRCLVHTVAGHGSLIDLEICMRAGK